METQMDLDHWTTEGRRVTDDEVLSKLRAVIEDESALIVEHRFYRGARAPHHFVCNSFDALSEYLRQNGRAGDAFSFWRFEDCCRDDNVALDGKVPDAQGRTPEGGPY